MPLDTLASARARIGRGLSRIEWGFSVLANLALVVMAFAVTVDTILRYFFSSPLPSVHTFTELYLLPAFVFGTAAYLQKQNGNISVDVLRKDFSPYRQHVVNLLARLGAFVVFAPMAWLALENGIVGFQRGDATTGIVSFPTSYTWFIIAVGLAMLSVRLLRQAVRDAEVVAGRREPVGRGAVGDPEDGV